MDHDTDDTASQDGMQGCETIAEQDANAQMPPGPEPAVAKESLDEDYAKMIDDNLVHFRGQFRRLKEAIEEHIRNIESGAVEDKDVNDIIKRIDPLLKYSMLEETKIHDKLAQRLGQAGKHAVDLGCARIEVGRRLARLRNAAGNA